MGFLNDPIPVTLVAMKYNLLICCCPSLLLLTEGVEVKGCSMRVIFWAHIHKAKSASQAQEPMEELYLLKA